MSCVCAVLAMPYPFPYALPDEPGYAAPAYGGAIGRVKIQVSFLFLILFNMTDAFHLIFLKAIHT